MESVDAHKQLYESKKKAVEAVQKKDRARDFKETACKDVAYRGWQFIR